MNVRSILTNNKSDIIKHVNTEYTSKSIILIIVVGIQEYVHTGTVDVLRVHELICAKWLIYKKMPDLVVYIE